jgi:tetratricopeptide (TPR) repeat protein
MPAQPSDAREETFAQRLRRVRLERGLSQRQLSSPGVSYAYVSRLEAEARRPSVKAIRTLARRLGVSAEYLETGEEMGARESLELRLADAELALRFDDDAETAEQTLRAILREAEEAGDDSTAMRAHATLGLAAHGRADFELAIAELECALTSGRLSPASHPDLYGTLGHAYSSADQTDRAVALFEHCLREIEEESPESRVAYIRFASYLSYALSDLGELARARGVLAQALGRADEGVDPYSRIRLHGSQARLAASDRDPQTALHELRRAIALLETTEDTRQLGRAHLLYAEVLTLEGDPVPAGDHLELAEQLLGDHADRDDLYWLRTEQARRAAELGDGDEAVARANEALDLIGDADPAEQGSALWALGQGLAAADRGDEAVVALRRAVELLESQGRWREAGQASRALGSLLRGLGRTEEAFDALERATDLAGRIGPIRARR